MFGWLVWEAWPAAEAAPCALIFCFCFCFLKRNLFLRRLFTWLHFSLNGEEEEVLRQLLLSTTKSLSLEFSELDLPWSLFFLTPTALSRCSCERGQDGSVQWGWGEDKQGCGELRNSYCSGENVGRRESGKYWKTISLFLSSKNFSTITEINHSHRIIPSLISIHPWLWMSILIGIRKFLGVILAYHDQRRAFQGEFSRKNLREELWKIFFDFNSK